MAYPVKELYGWSAWNGKGWRITAVKCDRCKSRKSPDRPCKRCLRYNLQNRPKYDWKKPRVDTSKTV